MSKIYKLSLKQKSGLLTELQSDTIFGHFCWRMKEISGEDTLIEFLKLFNSGNPVFTVSNSLFEREGEVFFPNPLLPKKNESVFKTKNERIESFLNYKKEKERKFITFDELNKFLNGESDYLNEQTEKKFEFPKYKEDLRTSVEISRETFSSKEGQLFSYAPFYVEEKLIDHKKQIYSDTKTVTFVKVIDKMEFENYKCKEIIEEVFQIGFGKKKSSGYGEFKVVSLEIYTGFCEPKDSNGFISLSNYLPSKKDNLTDCYYDFIVKYGKLGEELALRANPFKKPIVLLTPGSVLFTNEDRDFYGRCTTPGEISESFPVAIQNGYAFSLKANLKISESEFSN